MALLNQWIDGKLHDIANKLPTLVHQDAASFACGYNTGYKAALIDLEKRLDSLLDTFEGYPLTLPQVYESTHELSEIF
jgi:hypothetical protein